MINCFTNFQNVSSSPKEFVPVPGFLFLPRICIFSVEPLTTVAVKTNSAKILLDSALASTVHDPHVSVGFGFRAKFAEENPETAQKIIKIMKKAVAYMEANPEESRKIMAKYTDFPEELTASLGWSLYTEASEIENELQIIADEMLKLGFLKKTIKSSEIIYSQ